MLLLLIIPPLSLAGIAASALARQRSVRWIFGVMGWLGWLASVTTAMFVAFVVMAFSGWSEGTEPSTVGVLVLVLGSGVVALVLPALVAARLDDRRQAAPTQ